MAEDHYKELLDRLEEEFAGLKIDMDALYEGMRERLNRSPKFPFVLSAHALARFENDFCNPGNQHLYPVDGEWYFIHGDIDNFKKCNSRFGMAGADRVIEQFGRVLNGVQGDFGDAMSVYHVSGDEFAIVCRGAVRDKVIGRLRKVEVAISLPRQNDGVDESICAHMSFGCALIRPAADMTRAKADAEQACSLAKTKQRGDKVVIHDPMIKTAQVKVEERFRCSCCHTTCEVLGSRPDNWNGEFYCCLCGKMHAWSKPDVINDDIPTLRQR